MSSATFVGTTNPASPSGFCSVPPPPPPPPVAGQVPAMRINTVEPPTPRRSQVCNNDSYEPPAAIQNAMMTKDKKPFTYTPGMGGKLDLSQIRSPRMARRVAKNANDEGIEGPPKSPLATEQSRSVPTGTNLFVQPQVAVPVFPTNPSTLQVNRTPNVTRAPPNVNRDVESEPLRPTLKIDQSSYSQSNSPDTPSTPTQVTLTKAPTPWMQKNKQQEELPEWAKRSVPNESFSTRDTPNNSQTIYIQQPSQQKSQPKPASNECIIPLCVEDRPSVFAAKNEQGHHQFKQSSPHHQQRWGQSVQQPQTSSTPRAMSTPSKSPQPNSPGTYIVPIVVENSNNTTYIQRNDFPGNPIQNQPHKNAQKTPAMYQQEFGPVQSKSFRVLQKITDTDRDDIDTEQLRKLQLTEDDKILMNKFKEQVDGDTYLHQEEDPRYRGAAIPSRAFRYLQNMTDSNEVLTNTNAAPRAVNSNMKRQNRNSRTFEETQMNLPPSEQQVPEPKKYTGSAIPSRSFRILQAMTSPEDLAKQEIGQADFTCQVSSSMMPLGNQQGVFIPHYSQPIYWAYYPIPYQYNQLNYHQLHQNNINVPNITNSISYCHYQDINKPSSDTITDHSVSSLHYPFYHGFTSINNQNLVEEQETNSNNSLDSPAWVGAVVQVFSQPTTNPSQCSDLINKDNTYSMNILHEEGDYNRKINLDDTDRLTNDDNIIIEPQVSSTEESSHSSDSSNSGNPPNDDEIEVEVESTSSDDDSDSYLEYSTGLNFTKESRDKLRVPEIKDKQNITDCESYTEEEELDITMKSHNYIDNDSSKKFSNNVETTVNISLPMKFKFSVSTDDETTTVNAESKKGQSHESEADENPSNINHDDKNDVCVNLKINYDSDACANFTLKKKTLIKPKSWCPDESSKDFWISETVVAKQSSSFTNSSLQECIIQEEDQDNSNQEFNKELNNEIKILPEFEITVNEVQNVDEDESIDGNQKNSSFLTIQSSRDETDDDDSGVTSDMSRLISEVDTDSECTSSRKLNTYTRTQTHSRLFKLLTDDLTITSGDTEATILESKSARRHKLNLPLRKSSRFSYDSSKDSNSILDNSLTQKPTWRKLNNSLNGQTEIENNDDYFKTWKKTKQSPNYVQSLKHSPVSIDKTLNYWSYKTNVSCPRVKSGKNVPKILEGRVSKPVVHPISSCIRYDRC